MTTSTESTTTTEGDQMRGGLRKRAIMAAAALVLVLLAPGAGARDDDRDHDRARAALQAGEIRPLSEILAAAAREFPGEVLEVELEREHGQWIYEMKVLGKGGAVLKLQYDARDATLLRARGPGLDERRRR